MLRNHVSLVSLLFMSSHRHLILLKAALTEVDPSTRVFTGQEVALGSFSNILDLLYHLTLDVRMFERDYNQRYYLRSSIRPPQAPVAVVTPFPSLRIGRPSRVGNLKRQDLLHKRLVSEAEKLLSFCGGRPMQVLKKRTHLL